MLKYEATPRIMICKIQSKSATLSARLEHLQQQITPYKSLNPLIHFFSGSHVTYGHFAKGQGNNHNTGFFFTGGSNEDCALIRRSDGGLWHDYPCNPILGNLGYHYTYACEFRK